MDDLSVKQIKSIALLCEGKRQTTVAVEMKLRVETLRRWSKDFNYRSALTKARAMVWHDSLSEASVHVSNELAILQRISLDETASDSARVSAARAFIELTKPPIELTQDGLAEGDHTQVVVYLPDNGRGDYGGSIQQRGEED